MNTAEMDDVRGRFGARLHVSGPTLKYFMLKHCCSAILEQEPHNLSCRGILNLLAEDARPTSDDDWGTDRQIDASNAFSDALEMVFTDARNERLSGYALKATDDEWIDFALVLLDEQGISK